jgi:hypothetical protein
LASSNGFMLGVIGGLLDFGSASTIALNQGGPMVASSYLMPGDAWAALLVVLGAVVVASAVLSVTMTGAGHFRGFSLLMVALGVVMAAIGALMSGGSVAGSSLIFSYGMVIVGALMAINGVVMLRAPMPI